jgi:hypothetical protein
MKSFFTAGALALAALIAASGVAGEALQSGPQAGKTPGVFDPLHVTGPAAGEKTCLV